MGFDVAGAKQAGYTDTEIADHLATEAKFDATAARKAGYTDAEIIGHLEAAPQAAPQPELSPREMAYQAAKIQDPQARSAAMYNLMKEHGFGSGIPKLAYDAGAAVNDIAAKILPAPLAAGLGAATNAAIQVGPSLLTMTRGGPPYLAKPQTAADVAKVQNAVRDQALSAGRGAGYVVPPSTINPTLANSTAESLGGKIATAQQASVVNQRVSDTLGRAAIGLRPDAPLTEQVISNMQKAQGQAYQAVKDVGGRFIADPQFTEETKAIGSAFSKAAEDFPNSTKNAAIEALNKDLKIGNWSPTGVVEKIKLLRSDAAANFKAFNDPEKLALARAQRQAADALDGLITRNLASQGKGELAQSYQAARVNLAKLHDVEAALTPGGHIDARVLAKIGENGFLSGELKTISDFAGNFPKAVQTGEKIGSPMVHAVRPAIGSAVGSAVGASIGGPVGAALGAGIGAGAGVGIPWLARGAMLSGLGQSLMATPRYGPALMPQATAALSRYAFPLTSPLIGALSQR